MLLMLGNTWRKLQRSAVMVLIQLEEVSLPPHGAGGHSSVREDVVAEAESDWAAESSCGVARMTHQPIHSSVVAIWPDCTRQSPLPDWLTPSTPLKLLRDLNTEKQGEERHQVLIPSADYNSPPSTILLYPFLLMVSLMPMPSN